MTAPLLVLVALLASSQLVPAQSVADPAVGIAERIDELLARPAARRSLWGVLVRDVDSGAAVYERNADKLFLPASNVKLLATALALSRLGPDYRVTTVLAADGEIDEHGTLHGDLRFVGAGDPNLSSRVLPYRRQDDYAADRLAPLRALARQARDAGLKRVAGDLVGDGTRYVWQPYAKGWSYADTLEAYGSATSALVFNDNLIRVLVTPGATGSPALLAVSPALPYYEFVNRTVTVQSRFVDRRVESRHGDSLNKVVLTGQMPARSRGRAFELAARDPALYAALALREALKDAGIPVDGGVVAKHLLPDSLPSLRSAPARAGRPALAPLAEMPSQAISEAIRVVNKDSQNLHAEMLIREVAYRESGLGSREAAIESLQRLLAEAGVTPGSFHVRDGSGLSRHNLLTPDATVRLLEHMWHSEHRAEYLASLPVAGHDGTLDWRFQRSAARGRIHAKTGSMSSVLALSGYVRSVDGPTFAFSIFANNFGLASSSTRELVDSIAAALVQAGPS